MMHFDCRKKRNERMPGVVLMAFVLIMGLAAALAFLPTKVFAEGDVPAAIFDGNGGTVSAWLWNDESQDYEYTTSEVLAIASEDNDGVYLIHGAPDAKRFPYELVGWSLEPDGEAVYFDGDYQITEDTIFYAKWKRAFYLLYFDAGKGGTFPSIGNEQYCEIVFYKENNSLKIPTPKKNGYVFSHWKDRYGERVDFHDEDGNLIYEINKPQTFTAEWVEGVPVTLKANAPNSQGEEKKFSWEGNEQTEIELRCMPNKVIGDITDIQYSSDFKYRVVGWKNEKGKLVNPEEVKAGSSGTTLYAVWKKILKVELHANDGSFDPEKNEPTHAELLDMGDDLSQFAQTYVDDVKVWTGWGSGHIPKSNTEGEVFEGWYTDAACTQGLEQETVTESFINECEGTLDLYAKYTANKVGLTLHGNGGKFNEENDTAQLEGPRGYAVNIKDAGLNYYDEEAEGYKDVRAWYSDEGMTRRVDLIDGEYYVLPDEDSDLYPRWGKRFSESVDIWGKDTDFYCDGDYEVSVTLYDDDENEIDDDSYTFSYSLEARDGETDRVVEFDNADNRYFSVEGKKIIFHGEAIRGELQNNDSELCLTVLVEDEYGDEVCSDTYEMLIRDPFVEYEYSFYEQSVDYSKMIVGESLYFYRDSRGCEYNNANPDGRSFDFEILYVQSSDKSVISIEKNENDYMAHAVKAGEATLTIWYIDMNGDVQTKELGFEVRDARYNVDFDWEKISDTRFTFDRTLELRVEAYRERINPNYNDETDDYDELYIRDEEDLEYRWKSDTSSVNVDAVDDKPGCAIVSADESFLDEEKECAVITVEIWSDGILRDSTDINVYPCQFYYELTNMSDVDPMMRKGKSLKITPKVRYYYMNAASDKGYDEVGGVKFKINYDSHVFTAKDSKGSKLKPGALFTGSCTITRTGFDEGTIDISVSEIPADSDYPNENLPEIWSGSVYELYDFSKAKIGAIKNVVYKGKAFKPNPKVKYSGFDLDRNYEYTVSYKNNTKVGTATVTFTGKDRYCGTIKKTFKINPKGTSLKKLKKGKKSFTVTWKKNTTQTTGYQIQYSLKKNFKGAKTVTIKKNKTVKKTIKKLKAKKKYYVKIRTYKQIGKAKYYSSWSKVKTIKTK